ncbi:MAG: DEAD/DEAH box helicase [Alphaproteobacteria bacterium]
MSRKQKVSELIENVKSLMESDTNLRKSQIKALHQFTDREEAPERGIFNLATGVGKTRVMSMLALAYLQNNPDSQIVVGIPSLELFQQEMDAFQEYKSFQDEQREKLNKTALNIPEHLDMGVFNRFDKNTTSQIIFTSYHSLEKLAKQMDTSKVGLLLLDEAHHVVSEKRSQAVNSFTNALHYGMSATPWYSPERDARNVLGDVIAKISIKEAIQEGALAEYKNVLMVSDIDVDLSNVKKDTTGDYDKKEYWEAISHAIRGNSVTSGNVDNWQEAHHFIAKEVARNYHDCVDEHIGPWNGKKCLINCRSQEEARIQVQELNKLFGRMVARVHTSEECESQTIQDFKNGDLLIVCQVGKLTEGFDMPNLDMTINYPTASLVHEAQGAARCIRLPKMDSKTPQIPLPKMGLVVDIAFKNPNYDNIVDAIRENGQKLFQDVDGVKSPIIQHTDEMSRVEQIDKDKLEELRNKTQENEKTPKPLPPVVTPPPTHPEPKAHPEKYERMGFKIISDMQELQRLTRKANELKEKRAQEEIGLREGVTSTIAAQIIGCDVSTAIRLIKLYEGKTVLNPETGIEEPCTKIVKDGRGKPCLGFSKLGFEKVQREYQEEREGYTSSITAEVLGCNLSTAIRLIKRYEGKTVLNPKTGLETPCTKKIKNRFGSVCTGLTKLGLEEAIKERKEKEKNSSKTSPTLRPRLKAGSTQGKPKAPAPRKPATPEM